MLDYPSRVVKNSGQKDAVRDITSLLKIAQPDIVYTHNLADRHDTHVAVGLRVIEAIRKLPADKRPKRLYGCEVWRDLDWMSQQDTIKLDCSERQNLQMALLAVFDSQINGGKRYDLATMGRRRANATFSASHEVDKSTGLSLAMDLSPLIEDINMDIQAYVREAIDRFASDVEDRLSRVG